MTFEQIKSSEKTQKRASKRKNSSDTRRTRAFNICTCSLRSRNWNLLQAARFYRGPSRKSSVLLLIRDRQKHLSRFYRKNFEISHHLQKQCQRSPGFLAWRNSFPRLRAKIPNNAQMNELKDCPLFYKNPLRCFLGLWANSKKTRRGFHLLIFWRHTS